MAFNLKYIQAEEAFLIVWFGINVPTWFVLCGTASVLSWSLVHNVINYILAFSVFIISAFIRRSIPSLNWLDFKHGFGTLDLYFTTLGQVVGLFSKAPTFSAACVLYSCWAVCSEILLQLLQNVLLLCIIYNTVFHRWAVVMLYTLHTFMHSFHFILHRCVQQAPAPMAFPMTTPQVPVYGMVGIMNCTHATK